MTFRGSRIDELFFQRLATLEGILVLHIGIADIDPLPLGIVQEQTSVCAPQWRRHSYRAIQGVLWAVAPISWLELLETYDLIANRMDRVKFTLVRFNAASVIMRLSAINLAAVSPVAGDFYTQRVCSIWQNSFLSRTETMIKCESLWTVYSRNVHLKFLLLFLSPLPMSLR